MPFNMPALRVDFGSHTFNGRSFARAMGTWCFLLIGASAPFIVLRNVYPARLLVEDVNPTVYYDISKYLISNFNYIGIAIVVAYVPTWLGDIKTTRISKERRGFLYFIRSCTAAAALLCLAQLAALHQEMIIAPRNFQSYVAMASSEDARMEFAIRNHSDVLERKYYIYWTLFGIILGTFVSAFAANPLLERRTIP